MKIGDLWVKLGLKKDEFSRGMKEAGSEIAGSGGLLSKFMQFKAGAIAVWTAVGAAALKLADKFAHTSQRLGDAWDTTMAGMKGAWNTFIAAVNSTDFSNLGKRIADSFREAKQLAAMKDEEFEVMNSIELQKAAMSDELAILQLRMRNQKLSQKQREEAARDYLEKVSGIYKQEAEYRKKYAIEAQNNFLTGAGVRETKANREALQSFLTSVAPNGDVMEALDEFKKNGFRYSNEAQRQLIQGIAEQTGAKAGTLARLADAYLSRDDKQAKDLVDSIVRWKASEGAFNEETRRVQSVLTQNVTGGGGGGADDGRREAERILQRAEDSAKSELQILTEKYMQERALLQAFGMDVTALSDEYSRNVERLLEVPIDKMQELDDMVVDVDIEIDDDPVQEFIADYEASLQRMQDVLEMLRDAAIEGLSSAVQELADQFAGLEEINPGRVVQTLLTPLADMAIKEGELLIAVGVGVEACKEALESLQGPAAIAAGVALLALGAMAKSGLAAIARSGAGSTATTSYGTTGGASAAATQTIQTEMTVYVTGRLSGSDILLSGQKTQSNWNR